VPRGHLTGATGRWRARVRRGRRRVRGHHL